jgi:multisubunit Na+/H+ antiporter MnhF subunit
MTAWFVAAAALVVATVPLWLVVVRADTMSRLVALDVIGVMGSLTLVCLAQGFDRSVYSDLALVLAVLSFISGLTYARLLERWL